MYYLDGIEANRARVGVLKRRRFLTNREQHDDGMILAVEHSKAPCAVWRAGLGLLCWKLCRTVQNKIGFINASG